MINAARAEPFGLRVGWRDHTSPTVLGIPVLEERTNSGANEYDAGESQRRYLKLFHIPGRGVNGESEQERVQQMRLAEDVQRQVTAALVVNVEESARVTPGNAKCACKYRLA